MGYRLGVDLGTTHTRAAVSVDGAPPTLLALSSRAPEMTSDVFVVDGNAFVVGEAADQRGASEPDRLVRGVKQQLAQDVPVTVGTITLTPDALVAALLRKVAVQAGRAQGGAPTELLLTHPATWGADRLALLDRAAALAGVSPATRVSEPLAAAAAYASRTRVDPGAKIAIYDLGGVTFDAAVLARGPGGFVVVGEPQEAEPLGGDQFDEAVYRLVLGGLGTRMRDLDESDPEVARGLAQLRRDCRTAKVTLSTQTQASVRVELPGVDTTVRVTRSEFESLIRSALRETTTVLRKALDSAQTAPQDLTALVLVGGSAAIPAVSEVLQREFGVPVDIGPRPQDDVALGSLLLAPPPAGAVMNGVGPGLVAPVSQTATPPVTVAAPDDSSPPRSDVPGVRQPAMASGGAPAQMSSSGGYPPPNQPPRNQPPQNQPPQNQPPQNQPFQNQPAPPPRPGPAAAWNGPQSGPTQQPPGYGNPPRPSGPPPGYPQGPPQGPPPQGPPQQGPPPGYPQGPRRAQGTPGFPSGHAPMPPGPPGYGGGGTGSDGGSKRNLILLIVAGVVVLGLIVTGVVWFVRGRSNVVATPTVVPGTFAPPTPTASGASPTPTPTASASGGATATPSLVPSGPKLSQELPTGRPLPANLLIVPVTRDGERDLYLVDVAKKIKTKALNSPIGADQNAMMQPNRTTIIYIDANKLRVMGTDGGDDRLLLDTLPKGCGKVLHASWSQADADQLMLQCQPKTGASALMIIKLDGTVVRRVKVDQPRVDDAALSPDGQTIAYWGSDSFTDDGGAIYTVPADGSTKPTRLTKSKVGVDADPAWSPDGERLAFRRRLPNGSQDGNPDVYTMNADGSEVKAVSKTPAADVKPVWSPNGKELLVVSNRSSDNGGAGDTYDLWLVKAGNGRVVRHLGLKADYLTTPFWVQR